MAGHTALTDARSDTSVHQRHRVDDRDQPRPLPQREALGEW
jgi:hypothetical protein